MRKEASGQTTDAIRSEYSRADSAQEATDSGRELSNKSSSNTTLKEHDREHKGKKRTVGEHGRDGIEPDGHLCAQGLSANPK